MAQLRSLYASEVTAMVPTDSLSPKPAVVTGVLQSITQDGGVTHGRSLVTIAWDAPTENEDIGGEFMGIATGGVDNLETLFDPVVASPSVYEASNFGGGGRGDTTLTGDANKGDLTINVLSAANFADNDWVQLFDGGTAFEYVQIDSINANILTLKTKIQSNAGFSSGDTTKEADLALKTITTDYTIVLATGVLATVGGQFTVSNHVVIAYATTVQDLDGFELYRNPAVLGATDKVSVAGDGGTVVVSTAIAAGATSHQDTLTATENGETWYYYLYAKDDESSPNFSDVAVGTPLLVETIPSIPQNLGKNVGDASVELSWDTLGPGSSDANSNGYNVYRNAGAVLVQANLEKLNLILIPKAQLIFQDSQAGITSGDRVAQGTVPIPINGNSYTYVIESEDTTTNWTTGTQNQSMGQAAVLTGQQTP